MKQTPRTNPVRRAYELRRNQNRPSIEGGQPSYDQAAALFAVRGAEPEFWEMSPRGRVRVEAEGLTTWQADAERQTHLRQDQRKPGRPGAHHREPDDSTATLS